MPQGDSLYKISLMFSKMLSFFKSNSQHKSNNNHISNGVISAEINNSWIKYQSLKAEDIMIPRIDINALDYKSGLTEISKTFINTRHTRMPVYKGELDNIIGFINIKDILPYILDTEKHQNFNIDEVLRKLLIISPSMKLDNLLEKMRQTRTHIALVVDEFGGADGLITIEDLVEEIIGEIEDEHDQNSEDLEFKIISSTSFEASGRIEIEALENKLQLKLTEEEGEKYDTLGGLILSLIGSVPNKGDKIPHVSTGLIFEILDSDPRRIKRVLIHKS